MALFRRQRGRFIPPEARSTLQWVNPSFDVLRRRISFSPLEEKETAPLLPQLVFSVSYVYVRSPPTCPPLPTPTPTTQRGRTLLFSAWTGMDSGIHITAHQQPGVVNATIINSPKIPQSPSYDISALFFGFLVLSSPRLRINGR